MPEKTIETQNKVSQGESHDKKKSRLGRGLGSLLGANADLSTQPTDSKTATSTRSTVDNQKYGLSNQQTPPLSNQDGKMTRPLDSQTAQSSAVSIQNSVPINEESQIWKIPIDRLVANTQQPRQTFTHEALRDLTASIREQGILQPITARRLSERKFEIIAGERRWRAAQAAGLHEVPVILKNITDKVSLELALVENIQRENLNPLEEAESMEHLLKTYSMTQQQVAEKLGKDRSSVANALRLLTLPRELREMIRTTELSTGHAKVLMGVDNPETQTSLARRIVDEKLSVRATEKLVAKAKTAGREIADAETSSKGPVISKRMIEGLAADLQKLIGTKVGIDYAEGRGRLNMHFYTDEQLNSIVEKLRKSWHT